MSTRNLTRAFLSTAKPMNAVISHSYTTAASSSSSSALIPKPSFIFRLRPLAAAASSSGFRRLSPALSSRGFSTRPTSSSLNDPNPNWSNRPPKETILLDGCDFEHWLVVVEKPEGDMTRDDIIDGYIKTLATVVGSEEEARMKIYSVSTRCYFAFGALVSEELSYKLKELPNVRWVLPDSYLDVRNKDYGGEPFINGEAVPYHPKYHEEWERNNARANDRNRRNDRPRNHDRPRTQDRRRDMQNTGGSPTGGPTNFTPQNSNPSGNYPPRGPPANNNSPNYQHGPSGPGPYQPGPSGPGPYQPGPGQMVPAQGQNHNNAYPPYQGQNVPAQPPNRGYDQGPNVGGYAPNSGHAPGPNQNYAQSQNGYGPNVGPGQGQNQGGYGVGPGQGQNQGGYGSQNVPGRDPNY